MELTFEIYRGDKGELFAQARDQPILAQGENLGELLKNIEKEVAIHCKNRKDSVKVSCVWRDGESGSAPV